jgi:hypothetical protein
LLLLKRGALMRSAKFDKARKVEEEIDSIKKEHGEDMSEPR